jgi:hypothetical protein
VTRDPFGDDTSWNGRQSDDTSSPRRPKDRLAVASVVLSSLWLWWIGSVMGLVLGLVALVRHGSRPDPRASLRWATTGIGLGLLGLATFAVTFGPPITTHLRRHFEDSAAQSSIADLLQVLRDEDPTGSTGYPTAAATTSRWTVPGGSAVEIVGPGTASTGFKKVSVEVWNLSVPSVPGLGGTVYAAVLSGSGACFFLKENASPSYTETEPTLAAPCAADTARDITTWASQP